MALGPKDTAITVARFGAARFGATRFGFTPKETKDPNSPGSPGPHYKWADDGHQDDTPSLLWVAVLNAVTGVTAVDISELAFIEKTLTNAEVVALNTTPVELVPASSNFAFIPLLGYVKKKAGAYTVGSATHFQIRQTDGSGLQLTSTLLGALPQFDLAAAGVSAGFLVGPGSSVANYVGIGATSAPLVAFMNGGNPSGAGGELVVKLYYFKIPLN